MRLFLLGSVVLALLAGILPASAEPQVAPKRSDLSETAPPHPLPPPATTDQVVTLSGRTLHFKATAGAVRLSDAGSGAPLADVGYKFYRLETHDPAHPRPLVIALNGGPGASSAWLDLGALGPWRLPLRDGSLSPSAPIAVVDNDDTWLDFADLLFIDPVGTGYSRTLGHNEDAEKSFFSVDGDIDSLATVLRKWLVANDRLQGPKYIVGESYGGFRAPRLAHRLEQTEGVGINGIVMISPVLDFGWFAEDDNPAAYAGHLPSLVAAARHLGPPDPRARLADAEAYAAGPYLVDLYKGLRDAAARERMTRQIAALTGFDPNLIGKYGGRVEATLVLREINRADGKIASPYETNTLGFDPDPFSASSHHEDPVLDTLKVPLAGAMAEITANRLKWPVNARYEILNTKLNAHWNWDNGRRSLQSMSNLAALLSLDANFHALIMHGVTDQVTPYFTSQLLIDQLPAYGDPSRVKVLVYGGGHMPYLIADSRAAMREDARRLIENAPSVGQP